MACQACQASLSITNSQNLLKLMPIESVMPSNHLILCHPLLLPSIFPSIRVFSNEMFFIWWPKYWSFSFSISPSNEYSELISFRMDWLDECIWFFWSHGPQPCLSQWNYEPRPRLGRVTQDGWIMVESSDKTWSTGEHNGKPLQHSCLRTTWTVWKGRKIWHWKMNSPGC